MFKTIAITLAAAASTLVLASPAEARQGCGNGGHRGPYGHCRPNGWRGAPGRPVVGVYYGGRGYWDGRRYWQHRERHRGGWRYR